MRCGLSVLARWFVLAWPGSGFAGRGLRGGQGGPVRTAPAADGLLRDGGQLDGRSGPAPVVESTVWAKGAVIRWARCSASITQLRWLFARGAAGIDEASATRRP